MEIKNKLLIIYLFGSIGSVSELFLLDHTEDYWQLIPIVLLLFSMICIGLIQFIHLPSMIKIFRILMIFFMFSGVLGVYQHFEGNLEFILEMYPTESGFTLFWKTIKGATPVLAPGTMTLLGLIGYLYTSYDIESKNKLNKG